MNNRLVVEVLKIPINCNAFVDSWENDNIQKLHLLAIKEIKETVLLPCMQTSKSRKAKSVDQTL